MILSQIEQIRRNTERLQMLLEAHPQAGRLEGFAHCPPDGLPQISFSGTIRADVSEVFGADGWIRRNNFGTGQCDFFLQTMFGVFICIRNAEPADLLRSESVAMSEMYVCGCGAKPPLIPAP